GDPAGPPKLQRRRKADTPYVFSWPKTRATLVRWRHSCENGAWELRNEYRRQQGCASARGSGQRVALPQQKGPCVRARDSGGLRPEGGARAATCDAAGEEGTHDQ